MPAQDFAAAPRDLPHRPFNIDLWARRTLVVLLALLPASMAAHEMRRSIGLDGISPWEGVYLALFIPLFAWIAFGFATSLIGFLLLTVGRGQGVRPIAPAPRCRCVAGPPCCCRSATRIFRMCSPASRSWSARSRR